jgi:hypothetical protein
MVGIFGAERSRSRVIGAATSRSRHRSNGTGRVDQTRAEEMSNLLENKACSGANRVIDKQPDSSRAGFAPFRNDNEKWRLRSLVTPTDAAPREFRGCANPTAVMGSDVVPLKQAAAKELSDSVGQASRRRYRKQRPRTPSPPLDPLIPLRLIG